MSKLLLNTITNGFIINKPIKLLVFDMAGTTVNEGGIIYDTLYQVMKEYNLNVTKEDKRKWYGRSKKEVMDDYFYKKYVNRRDIVGLNYMKKELYNHFEITLKKNYFLTSNISLMDKKMPYLFNKIRENNIKIALNTGYNSEIQTSIIENLKMNEFIDDYVSSDDVPEGRPFPHMIYKLMEKNNINNSCEVIKFGDTENDILEGKSAKCYISAGVLTGAGDVNMLNESDCILNSVMDISLF